MTFTCFLGPFSLPPSTRFRSGMLKRRASSPALLVDEVSSTNLSSTGFPRTIKRRRVVAPVLDSQARGWRYSQVDSHSDEDSQDESNLNLEEESILNNEEILNIEASEYVAANTLLHNLHAHHRQRLLHGSPGSQDITVTGPSLPTSLGSPSSKFKESDIVSFPPGTTFLTDRSSNPSGQGTHNLPTPQRPTEVNKGSIHVTQELPLPEDQYIREHYEETNRCVSMNDRYVREAWLTKKLDY
jgi:hypothetical protein